MSRFISVFPSTSGANTLIPATGVLAGDKVIQVQRVDGSGDETFAFAPIIPANGLIGQVVVLTAGEVMIALLERSGAD